VAVGTCWYGGYAAMYLAVDGFELLELACCGGDMFSSGPGGGGAGRVGGTKYIGNGC